MEDASTCLTGSAQAASAAATIWVLDDPARDRSGAALAIAERLGLPFRRVPLAASWLAPLGRLAPRGARFGLPPALEQAAAPRLVIGAGGRSAVAALWLKRHTGSRLVHCMRPGPRAGGFDLLVVGWHDHPPARANVLPVLGELSRLSPLRLRQAGRAWAERLVHLPHPRVALFVGGPAFASEMPPALAHGLGRQVATLARRAGGAVLAATGPRTGREATEALAAALGACPHMLHRYGEPGEHPHAAMLALADAVVVTADSAPALSEACATSAPVYVALPELAGARQRRLVASFIAAGQVRRLGHSLTAWARAPLDEATRVAQDIGARFAADLPQGGTD